MLQCFETYFELENKLLLILDLQYVLNLGTVNSYTVFNICTEES